MSPKRNYKRNTYFTDSKTYKSFKNREETKKWLPVQLTTFTVSYTYQQFDKTVQVEQRKLFVFLFRIFKQTLSTKMNDHCLCVEFFPPYFIHSLLLFVYSSFMHLSYPLAGVNVV